MDIANAEGSGPTDVLVTLGNNMLESLGWYMDNATEEMRPHIEARQ